MILRHLLAILALPFVVMVVVPVWVARSFGVAGAAPSTLVETLLALAGLGLLALGVTLFVACLRRFAVVGEGTLAPWDPPRNLVVEGPYRYVRNPMISGVILTLFAEALLLRSVPHTIWALAFLGLNLVYLPLLEEPQLEARFGEAYRRYKMHVPGLIPRLRAWQDD